jgi:hypothetical protein
VQLQQVLMNLCVNSIDAMKDVDGTRELIVKPQRAENERLMVSVSYTVVGFPIRRSRSSMPSLLPSPRNRHGTSHQPLHYRIAWWPLVGCRQLPRGGSVCFTLPTKAAAN